MHRSTTVQGSNNASFWHQQACCAGIKACVNIDQHLIEQHESWNCGFNPQHIGRILQKYATQIDTSNIDLAICEKTEQYVYII